MKAVLPLILLCLASTAQAQPAPEDKTTVMLIPVGTWLSNGDTQMETTEPLYALTRTEVERVMVQMSLAHKLRADVVDCTAKLDAAGADESISWVTTAKWTAVGAAVAGAFAIGLAVR